jgi:hypothetical protein
VVAVSKGALDLGVTGEAMGEIRTALAGFQARRAEILAQRAGLATVDDLRALEGLRVTDVDLVTRRKLLRAIGRNPLASRESDRDLSRPDWAERETQGKAED